MDTEVTERAPEVAAPPVAPDHGDQGMAISWQAGKGTGKRDPERAQPGEKRERKRARWSERRAERRAAQRHVEPLFPDFAETAALADVTDLAELAPPPVENEVVEVPELADVTDLAELATPPVENEAVEVPELADEAPVNAAALGPEPEHAVPEPEPQQGNEAPPPPPEPELEAAEAPPQNSRPRVGAPRPRPAPKVRPRVPVYPMPAAMPEHPSLDVLEEPPARERFRWRRVAWGVFVGSVLAASVMLAMLVAPDLRRGRGGPTLPALGVRTERQVPTSRQFSVTVHNFSGQTLVAACTATVTNPAGTRAVATERFAVGPISPDGSASYEGRVRWLGNRSKMAPGISVGCTEKPA